jgi:enoyl-CoA hydratase
MFEARDYLTLAIEVVEGEILVVRLNRPEVANAVNTRVGEEMVDLFESLQVGGTPFRAVVLTGTGEKAFCAGGDLKERNGMTLQQWQDQHLIFERMMRAFLNCPLPLICAVNGIAYGGGCEMAAAADFVYAADTARFALTEVRLGIMPGSGGTQNLPRAVGLRRAKELVLTGRPFSAAEALDWGLVNRVCPPGELLATALATAREIAANAPIAVRQAKLSMQRGIGMSLADALYFEAECYARMVHTEDRVEGVRAFNEKRVARFQGR